MMETKSVAFTIVVDGDGEKNIRASLNEAFDFALKNFKSGRGSMLRNGNVSKNLGKVRVYLDPPNGMLHYFNGGKACKHWGLVAFKKTKAAHTPSPRA